MAESPVTYQVQIIYDSLYGDMTAEEVQNEFARLLAPVLREKLKEKKSKKKEDIKKKKKKE